MKLKALLLSTLAATAIFASTGASANGFSISIGPHGHVSYSITVGHPHHYVAPQRWHKGGKRVHNQRHWRPAKRVHRINRHTRNQHRYDRHPPRRGHH